MGLNPEMPRIRQTHDGHLNYVDSSHWLSVLEDIREVREHLSPEGGILSQDMPRASGASWEPDPPEVGSVLGLEASTTMEDILASLPPRPICDRLLSHYFNSRFQVLGECLNHLESVPFCGVRLTYPGIIHPVEFQKEVPTRPLWDRGKPLLTYHSMNASGKTRPRHRRSGSPCSSLC